MAKATAHQHVEYTPPEPAMHFETLEKQNHAGRLGMWAFLCTEILLFAGLFGLYAVYRTQYPQEFHIAATHTHKALGTLNTFVLIFSSVTVAFAIHFARSGKPKPAVGMIFITLLCGAVFLYVKSIEYRHHFQEGIFPGSYYASEEMPHAGFKMYYTIYYFMTGLHGIHVVIGMVVLLSVLPRVKRGFYGPSHYLGIELAGMYWHLVDLIWIFLWPIFYLVE